MIVYVDIDGVLTDFVGAAYAACGYDLWASQELQRRIPCWEDIHVPLGVSAHDMWERIDDAGVDFWSHMPWLPDGPERLRTAGQMGEVRLCSTPANQAKHSGTGKLEWIARNVPWLAESYHLTPLKHELAGPDRLLIDDNPANCEAFIAAGGKALLVSHPFNANANPELMRL